MIKVTKPCVSTSRAISLTTQIYSLTQRTFMTYAMYYTTHWGSVNVTVTVP